MILFVAVLLLVVAPALLWLAGRLILSRALPGGRPRALPAAAREAAPGPAPPDTPPWYSRPARPLWGPIDRG